MMFWDDEAWVKLDPPPNGVDANLSIRDGQLAWTKVEVAPKYEIGLNNDLGGYVFYVAPDGLHGLVAATQDQSAGGYWNDAFSLVNNSANHNAVGANFTDWRLPTKDELYMMWYKKDAIGGFANYYYWCSTVGDYGSAWTQHFEYGSRYYNVSNNDAGRVRAVRAF